VNKSIIVPYNYRTLTLSLLLLVFVVVIFVMLYYNRISVHEKTIPITNPSTTASSAIVKEVSVNDNMSKNNNDIHAKSLPPPIVPPAAIKVHIVKTTASLLQPSSKSNTSNQQVSRPISNNNNKDYYHHHSPTIINSTQTVNSSTIPSLPQASLSVKYIPNKNATMMVTTSRSLPIVDNNTNNIQNNIPINNHLATVPHHVLPSKMTTTTNNNNNGSIVHKTIIRKASLTNAGPTEIFYTPSRITTQSSPQEQIQQQLNPVAYSDLDSVSIVIITANAGPNQKVKEGKKVTLDGTGSSRGGRTDQTDDNSTGLNFLWKQIAGKSVKLTHSDTAKAKFKAPHVKKTTKLKFKVTVDDGNGNSDSDTVKIIVKPRNHKHNHNHHKH
jgi:K319L-like, PKD domain